MNPWPECRNCGEPMPCIARGEEVDVHQCQTCRRIVVDRPGSLEWYTYRPELTEILMRFPHLHRFRLIHEEAEKRKTEGVQEKGNEAKPQMDR